MDAPADYKPGQDFKDDLRRIGRRRKGLSDEEFSAMAELAASIYRHEIANNPELQAVRYETRVELKYLKQLAAKRRLAEDVVKLATSKMRPPLNRDEVAREIALANDKYFAVVLGAPQPQPQPKRAGTLAGSEHVARDVLEYHFSNLTTEALAGAEKLGGAGLMQLVRAELKKRGA